MVLACSNGQGGSRKKCEILTLVKRKNVSVTTYLLVEDRLGLTTVTHLLVVVSSLTLFLRKTLTVSTKLENLKRFNGVADLPVRS